MVNASLVDPATLYNGTTLLVNAETAKGFPSSILTSINAVLDSLPGGRLVGIIVACGLIAFWWKHRYGAGFIMLILWWALLVSAALKWGLGA